MKAVRALLVVVAGCGRIGFDPLASGDGGTDAPIVPRWAHVATSGNGTCAITTTGELYCWGNANGGALGLGSGGIKLQPVTRIGTDTTWSTVALGFTFGCGLHTDQSLWCWGVNDHGQLPGKPPFSVQLPYMIPGTYLAVTAAESHACVIDTSHQLFCFGDGVEGVLGNGGTIDSPTLSQVGGTWDFVSTGPYNTCAIDSSAKLFCWGNNANGQVGDDTQIDRTTPVPVAQTKAWRSVDVAIFHGCAVDTTGAPYCWGDNYDGELGTNTARELVPTLVVSAPPLVSIDVGSYHSCGLTAAGEVYCWGAGDHGQLGKDLSHADTPLLVASATELSTNKFDVCIVSSGFLSCTGKNWVGQLGVPAGEAHVPTRADMRTDWDQIAARSEHACALTTSGDAYCWGENRVGEIGNGSLYDEQSPSPVNRAYKRISVGGYSVLGIAKDNDNLYVGGELPDLASTSRTHEPFGTGSATRVAVGESHSCRLLAGGTLVCGGLGNNGQLGDGTQTDSPAVTLSGSWKDVAASWESTCGITSADVLQCWGENTAGQLGDGTTNRALSPVSVTLPAVPMQITMAFRSTCALLANGEIWCWGEGASGQLGQVGSSTSPRQMGTRSDWLEVSGGDLHACAIASDRSLWCWGHADDGQLGLGAALQNAPSPQRVGSDNDWLHVACGGHFTCAIRTNGTRWCMGTNEHGELGDGHAWREQFTVIP